MAWFTCMAGVGGKGNSVIVTCDADFAGIPITCTNGQKTYTKVCPSFSPYEVTFSGLVAGTWTISATVDGVVYSTTAVVTDITAVLSYGFNWQKWVDSSSSLHSEDYTDLSDLLSDEAAIRQLFTEHAPTDYAASTATVTPDLATVLNNNLCAKWINLNDYALDTLYANPLIAAAMDSADKYFYGEWGIVDDTTTPPTWGPKGNVPVMTANTAPYGTVSASGTRSTDYPYRVFDGNTATAWQAPDGSGVNSWIQYEFVNPVCIKKMLFGTLPTNGSGMQPYKGSLYGSNDGSTWGNPLASITFESTTGLPQEFEVANNNHYKFYRLQTTQPLITGGNARTVIHTLQFYGRELSVSVPTMTSDTTPYGEVSYSGIWSSSFIGWQAFNPDSNYWISGQSGSEHHIAYEFPTPMVVKMLRYATPSAGDANRLFDNIALKGSNDGTNWEEIYSNNTQATVNTTYVTSVTNNKAYKYLGLFINKSVSSSTAVALDNIQFYGLDYSEKEFEEGSTKKWLYDHGVELETVQTNTTGGTATKGDSEILLTNTSAAVVGIGTSLLDTTQYHLLRCILGETLVVGGNSRFGIMGVSSSVAGEANISSIAITSNYAPNNMGLDITSDNGNYSLVAYGNTANNKLSIKELWLE